MGTLSHNPAKSTTGGRRGAGLRRAARRGTLAVLVALLAVGAGCSSARRRESPGNIIGNLRYHDSEAEARFSRTYRSGSLYQDYRTVLLVDAIAMNLEYRHDYVAMLGKTYFLPGSETEGMLRAEDVDFDGTFSFLLFLYGGSNRPIPLGEPISPWKVLLQDDDGQTLLPLSAERLRPENPNYRYLSLYFYGLDRWSQAFKISFPKLDKPALGLPLGQHAIELIVTGIDGTVRLRWKDPREFYRPPATAAAGAAPAKPPPEK